VGDGRLTNIRHLQIEEVKKVLISQLPPMGISRRLAVATAIVDKLEELDEKIDRGEIQ
jgi:hypothetical protein